MKVGDQVKVKSTGKVGKVVSVSEESGRKFYSILYPVTAETIQPLGSEPPAEAGILCSADNLEKVQ